MGEFEQHNTGRWEERLSSEGVRGGDRTVDVDGGSGKGAAARKTLEETAGGLSAERGDDIVAGAATMFGDAGAGTGAHGRNSGRYAMRYTMYSVYRMNTCHARFWRALRVLPVTRRLPALPPWCVNVLVVGTYLKVVDLPTIQVLYPPLNNKNYVGDSCEL